jgi:[ribosomal protein S18]-alanine N-acetyltransferase
MRYIVRPMTPEDVPQVTAIDREAFPTMWPPMNYQRELDNHLAHYIVIAENPVQTEEPASKTESNTGLTHKVIEWLTPHKPTLEQTQKIVGFAGFWMMAGEAHIISLAVKQEFRRQGFGKLLLIELVRAAVKLEAEIVTLEVRVSNFEAQRLYLQYGFVGKGVRRAYYTDNREDALIMTLDEADSKECVANFEKHRTSLKY